MHGRLSHAWAPVTCMGPCHMHGRLSHAWAPAEILFKLSAGDISVSCNKCIKCNYLLQAYVCYQIDIKLFFKLCV